MLIHIYYYVLGYLKVRLTGYSPERFFNLCSNREIEIREVKADEEGGYVFLIGKSEYEEIQPLLEKTRTHAEVIDQYGLPYFLHRYRKRKLFFLGFLLCLFIVYGLSLFVWDIQVTGAHQYSKEEMIDYVQEKYLTFGTLKSKVNCAKMEEDLREHYDQIAWISCELKGTQLRIQVKETLKQNEDVKNEMPCDIVARKAGIIKSIITRNGTPMVKEEQQVKKGEVLISGTIHIYDDTNTLLESELLPAQGDIMAQTVYAYEDSFTMSYYEKEYTGNKKTYYGIELLGKSYIPYTPKDSYQSKDQYEEWIPIRVGHTYSLPLSFTRYTRKEFKPVRKQYTKETANKRAKERLQKFIEGLSEKGVEIVKNNVTIVVDGESCKAEGTITVIESIGKIRQIRNNSGGTTE